MWLRKTLVGHSIKKASQRSIFFPWINLASLCDTSLDRFKLVQKIFEISLAVQYLDPENFNNSKIGNTEAHAINFSVQSSNVA